MLYTWMAQTRIDNPDIGEFPSVPFSTRANTHATNNPPFVPRIRMHNRYQVTSDARDFLNKASSLLEFNKLEATIFDIRRTPASTVALLFNKSGKRINVNNPRKQATQNAFAIQSIETQLHRARSSRPRRIYGLVNAFRDRIE